MLLFLLLFVVVVAVVVMKGNWSRERRERDGWRGWDEMRQKINADSEHSRVYGRPNEYPITHIDVE